MEQKNQIIPYIAVRNGAEAIEFYKKAFGARQTMRIDQPDGRVGHAEMEIDGALIMLSDEFPEISVRGPQTLGGSAVTLHLTVAAVDRFIEQTVAHGATLERPVKDEFYGMRVGVIQDPYGHRWMIGTITETLTNEEVERRASALHQEEPK